MNQRQAFEKLLKDQNWDEDFIGYGNPESKILIIGQEAADEEGSESWKKFYQPNKGQWREIISSGYSYLPQNWDGLGDYKFPDYFNPTFPFYQQKFKIRRIKKDNLGKEISNNNGTSSTWYWYQRLIDYVYYREKGNDGIDMFKHIFMTELNGHTRKNHKIKQNVEEHIKHRLDIMRATSYYWRNFDVVVFACGSYANKIENNSELLSDIFGDAHLLFCSQLSMNKARENVDRLGPQLKDVSLTHFCTINSPARFS